MKMPLYNLEGEKTKDLEVSDSVFDVKPKQEVVHQVFVALCANARQPWAHSKDRGDVRGGGKKPWRQKGTGRARHGSSRSPIWSGGGVTFGPLKNRNYKQKINKKMNTQAVRMCLSDKVADQRIVAIEKFEFAGKTKTFARLYAKLPCANKSTIILSERADETLDRVTRNVPKIDIVRAQDISVVDLLNHQYIVATPESIKSLEKRLTK